MLFRAACMAYGASQARGQIQATAAGLHHSRSNVGSEPHLRPTPQLMERQILNPLNEARDGTYILMDTSQIHFCWASMGTPPTPTPSSIFQTVVQGNSFLVLFKNVPYLWTNTLGISGLTKAKPTSLLQDLSEPLTCNKMPCEFPGAGACAVLLKISPQGPHSQGPHSSSGKTSLFHGTWFWK